MFISNVTAVNSERASYVEYVAHIEDTYTHKKVYPSKYQGKRSRDIILVLRVIFKTNLTEVGCDALNWITLAAEGYVLIK